MVEKTKCETGGENRMRLLKKAAAVILAAAMAASLAACAAAEDRGDNSCDSGDNSRGDCREQHGSRVL